MTTEDVQKKLFAALAAECDAICDEDYCPEEADAKIIQALADALRVSELLRKERLKDRL
ncbi:MAG: hypothetical protein IJ705_09550 [Oscillospiraceae bacterium]|nr:hypothetical protein [Oscillospiraceae bacterium]